MDNQIMFFLDDHELDIFSVDTLYNGLNYSRKQINESLFRLAQSGKLHLIEKGKYCRYNFADEYVIGNLLAKDGGIAYWTAMNIHGLTEQIPNVIYIQTTHAKQNKIIFGIRYRFIRVKKEKIIGFKTMGYGNHEYLISDLEKTIVDCFDLPKYSGGYNEIIKAFYKADVKSQKLVKYCKAYNNIAITKRLGYLCELLEKPNMSYFIKYAQSIRNEKYNLFESDGIKTGRTNRRWRLVINMDADEITEIAKS